MQAGIRQRALRRGAALVAAAALVACTTDQVVNVALSKDPKAAIKSLAQAQANTYARDPQALANDFQRLKAELDHLFGRLKGESEIRWGKDEAETLPAARRYVKYTGQYRNRIIVDYERNTIRIEHLRDAQVAQALRSAIVVALLTPQDPRAADIFSDQDVSLSGKPFLQDLVLDQNRKVMATRSDVERFADYLVVNRLQQRQIRVNNAAVDVAYVQFDMIGAEQDRAPRPPTAKKPPRKGPPLPVNERPDEKADDRADPNRYAAADKIAPKFKEVVDKYAQATGVDPALIFGIIYQESRFNPQAVSQAEAYGMMQLVPRSGGLEAYRKVKGEAVPPTREYLMDPERNIELGATYVNMLLFDYWMKEIANMPARIYCGTAAYNTGPGNVARAFTGSTRNLGEARDKANAMRPDEVFDFLHNNLPFAETRDYIVRVSAARRHYKELFYSGT